MLDTKSTIKLIQIPTTQINHRRMKDDTIYTSMVTSQSPQSIPTEQQSQYLTYKKISQSIPTEEHQQQVTFKKMLQFESLYPEEYYMKRFKNRLDTLQSRESIKLNFSSADSFQDKQKQKCLSEADRPSLLQVSNSKKPPLSVRNTNEAMKKRQISTLPLQNITNLKSANKVVVEVEEDEIEEALHQHARSLSYTPQNKRLGYANIADKRSNNLYAKENKSPPLKRNHQKKQTKNNQQCINRIKKVQIIPNENMIQDFKMEHLQSQLKRQVQRVKVVEKENLQLKLENQELGAKVQSVEKEKKQLVMVLENSEQALFQLTKKQQMENIQTLALFKRMSNELQSQNVISAKQKAQISPIAERILDRFYTYNNTTDENNEYNQNSNSQQTLHTTTKRDNPQMMLIQRQAQLQLIDQVQAQLVLLEQKNKADEAQLAEQKKKLENLCFAEEAITVLKADKQALIMQMQTMQKQIDFNQTLHTEQKNYFDLKNKLQITLDQLEKQKAQLPHQRNELTLKITQLQEQAKKQTAIIYILQEKEKALMKQLEDNKSALNDKLQNVQQIARLQDELQIAQETCNELQSRSTQAQAKYDDLAWLYNKQQEYTNQLQMKIANLEINKQRDNNNNNCYVLDNNLNKNNDKQLQENVNENSVLLNVSISEDEQQVMPLPGYLKLLKLSEQKRKHNNTNNEQQSQQQLFVSPIKNKQNLAS